jgi:CheY-like chemotaxis protein
MSDSGGVRVIGAGLSTARTAREVHVSYAPEALRAVEGGAFGAILCDVMMPEMTGAEFYRAVREKDSLLADRVVFMTGGAFVPRVAEFLSTVANPTLEKPLDVGKLAQMLGELTRREAQAEPVWNDGRRSV